MGDVKSALSAIWIWYLRFVVLPSGFGSTEFFQSKKGVNVMISALFFGADNTGTVGGLPVVNEPTDDHAPVTTEVLASTRQYKSVFWGRSGFMRYVIPVRLRVTRMEVKLLAMEI